MTELASPEDVIAGKSPLRRAIGVIYLVLVGAFVALALRAEWSTILDAIASVGPGTMAAALVCSIGALLAGMSVFRVLLAGMGEPVTTRGAFGIYFVSQLGKYLPVAVWPVVVQVKLGSELGVNRRTNVAAFFMGLILSIVIGLTTGFTALLLLEPRRWAIPAVLSVVAVITGIAALPLWEPVTRRLPGVIRRQLPNRPPTRRSLLLACGLLVVSWVLHGLQLAFLARGLGLELDSWLVRSVGAFAIAYASGVLIIVAPAGAGVREAIMATLLGRADLAIVAAVVLLSRFVLIAADVLLGLAGALITRRVLGPDDRSPDV